MFQFLLCHIYGILKTYIYLAMASLPIDQDEDYSPGEAIQQLEQNYPGVVFQDMELLRKELDERELQEAKAIGGTIECLKVLRRQMHEFHRQRSFPRFSYRVNVWGRRYMEEGKVSKKKAKNAAAITALNHLKKSVSALADESEANRIERMIEEKYSEVSQLENAVAMRKVLAGIVLKKHTPTRKIMKVVAIGTGTKCVPAARTAPGTTVNDCHGEIIARRAFQRYLYDQLLLCMRGSSESIFEFNNVSNKYRIKDGISFHMYISTPPCGDARVFMPVGLGAQPDEHTGRAKRGKSRCKIDEGEGSVLAERQVNGTRTVIMSCSDKMASWSIKGLQGTLLSFYIEPVFLQSIIVGKYYNYDHMSRAMYLRVEAVAHHDEFPDIYIGAKNPPIVGQASTSSYMEAHRSSNYSANWYEGNTLEVIDISNGTSVGSQYSRLCKLEMYKKWISVSNISMSHEFLDRFEAEYSVERPIVVNDITTHCSYKDIKKLAVKHEKVKELIKQHYSQYLGGWINTYGEALNDFTLQ